MKFSEQWLREWVSPDLTSNQLAEQLSMAGLEVDAVEPVAAAFDQVVVGEVVECGPHPDADKLQVTKVNVGGDELLDIVCGAPNCRQGLKVVVATVGATLPGDFKIKKAKLRGAPSHGMLCSSKELGLDDEHAGIIELPADAPVGKDYRQWLGLDDSMLDVDLTPNRADCLGIKGIAREVGVLNNLDVKELAVSPVAPTIDDTRQITLQAPQACPRYLGRVVRGIDVTKPTPLWMKERLRRSGVRSIDAVVDITNYVLLELGHPMHAFDLATLEGDIQVRMANTDESLTLLDGQTVSLQDDVLVIADEKKALAMAGIFGGEQSGVTAASSDIFLESAFFAPTAIMGRARRFGLHTDASHRYERGVDPELQRTAMERATELLLEICGGQAGPVVEAASAEHVPKAAEVSLRRERLAAVLGISVADTQVTEIMQRLGFKVTANDAGWQVEVPTYRFDIAIEEDLIEEVARVYGYNNIPSVAPKAALKMSRRNEAELSLRDAQRSLQALGYQEAITYSFVDPKHQAALFPEQATLTLPHPISVEMSSMRLSLWPGLLSAVGYNQKRQQASVRMFESGLSFVPDATAENGVRQQSMIAGVIAGSVQGEHWADGEQAVDFYDIKGHVENLLRLTAHAADFRFVASQHSALHPGQSAAIYLGERLVGYVGAVHPQFSKTFGLKGRVFAFELQLDAILQRTLPKASKISRYPSIRRDLALLVDEQVAAGEILVVIEKFGESRLVDLNLFDVYQGENTPAGKKSLAISMVLQDVERTLEENEVNEFVNGVVELLKNEFDAVLRDG
ncbi:phenylalanine--tRNA ligase subunit beta [Aliidiomarina sedimenti]|uniref:Phenylalanine--tRNA ligase beta subunit n=1 Tax=Aliidiomarina sedimenti TaxID=1933879 RepID=A0ABY0C259_9GAMM|nr:phenylalanine--tRNA ligase subunit beta [Aliidiomarina sedimenti]RUO31673.1 phenylalanine--tRNA ligase subunit beta [Aliidiomarina sedimenti]